ncbi:deoxyribodipyrimidine photo-lyase [Candidatus Flexifilum breve]|uniref:cryptochrome/photolyase family protein n=1 Tax=Candidatus Flexifilum breve TaxID=3140694 RepID=UPI0031CCAEB4
MPDAGEAVALHRLERFTADAIYRYGDTRNRLTAYPFDDLVSTSALSPYLRFGMLSPRQAYHAAARLLEDADALSASERQSIQTWISELAWRDFYNHILYHFPHVLERSFKPEYDRVEYRDAPEEFERWAAGMTGYPVIDAAMRQMNTLGWMHNRARMIVASFLTKDLLIYWRRGDLHFMQHLIDGDLAANNGGWQWSAGTGTDAQPYFRIFNPISQSEQYDPEGEYIRAFVPELRDVLTPYIHAPWTLPTPPKDYPSPMVEHSAARQRTLAAFKKVKTV